jgi:hypothetical protein
LAACAGWQQTSERSNHGRPPGEQQTIVALENETFKERKVGDNSHWRFVYKEDGSHADQNLGER